MTPHKQLNRHRPDDDEAACLATLRPLVERVRVDVTAVKRDGRSSWTGQPLTDERLRRHVNGGPARGVCPIKAGESTCAVGVLDLDSHKGETPWPAMAATALRLIDLAAEHGVHLHPFRSSGGRGVHLVALWECPQDARSVRARLVSILATCGLKNGTRGVAAGEVEVYPRQDSVPADGFGNQFILPLAGESVPLEPLAGLAPLPRATPVVWQCSGPVPVIAAPAPIQRERAASSPDLDELRDALASILADEWASYDEWLRLGMALHDATDGSDEGLDLWDAESQREGAGEYAGRELLEAKWRSFTGKDRRVTAASIFAKARDRVASDEDFEDLTAAPAPATPATKPPRFAIVPAAEFANRPPPRWIVRGVLPQADLAVIYGESGSGKSFAALDLTMSIARGVAWRGLRVKQGAVVYVAAEGAGGFRNRLRAYAAHHDVDLATVPFGVVHAAPNLLEPKDTRDLVAALKAHGPAAVIVVDTLAQTMPGGNENAGEDMGKALAHCRALQRATGALVLLVHHSGKDASKGARGWSGLRAACDAELEVVRTGKVRVLRTTKQKDGDDSGAWGFDLAVVPVGEDDDGEVITSCVSEPADIPEQAQAVGRALGKVELIVLAVIADMGEAQRTGIEVDAVVTEAANRMPPPAAGGRDYRRRWAQRALDALAKLDGAGFVREDDNTLTLV